MGKSLYLMAEWVSKLAYINILWILFTILGLVIFGFFPSTNAMFTVIRELIISDKEIDIPIFKTFYKSYKKEFIKGNSLGLIILSAGGIIYFCFRSIDLNLYSPLIYLPFYLSIAFILFTALYLFPVSVHFDINLYAIFKISFFVMLFSPIYNISFIITISILLYVFMIIPSSIIFFGGSALTYNIMSLCIRAFKKIEEKSGQSIQ